VEGGRTVSDRLGTCALACANEHEGTKDLRLIWFDGLGDF
jgi:hypothetical protein